MRTIAFFCLISLIDCTLAFSQVAISANGGSQAAEPTQLRVYPLQHTSTDSAMAMIRSIGPPCKMADEQRTNVVLVQASEEAHKKIEQLLRELDTPGKEKESVKIIPIASKAMEAGSRFVSEYASMFGVEVAFVEEQGILVIKGSEDKIEHVRELVDVIAKTSDGKVVDNAQLRSHSIRILWLSNDPVEDSRNVIEPDAALIKSIQKLSELGYANMKVKMQVMGRCDMVQGMGHCQVDGSHLSGNTLRTLQAQTHLSWNGKGLIHGKIYLEADVAEPRTTDSPSAKTSVQVEIHLEPKKYYILSASPIGGYQNAFVVQMIDDL